MQQNTPSVVELTREEMVKTSGGTTDPIPNWLKLLLGGGGAPIEPTAPVIGLE